MKENLVDKVFPKQKDNPKLEKRISKIEKHMLHGMKISKKILSDLFWQFVYELLDHVPRQLDLLYLQ